MERKAWRYRQHIPCDQTDKLGQQAAYTKAQRYREESNGQYLHHVDAEDQAAIGSCDFQCRDAGALAFQIAANAIANANPCDHQRREADKGQELACWNGR
jgi:hypothetical protein